MQGIQFAPNLQKPSKIKI